MYQNLGVQWAASIPAFLSLACLWMPYAFFKYGASIRVKQKYSREAAEMLAAMQHHAQKKAGEGQEKGEAEADSVVDEEAVPPSSSQTNVTTSSRSHQNA
jgi:hypothetical protein